MLRTLLLLSATVALCYGTPEEGSVLSNVNNVLQPNSPATLIPTTIQNGVAASVSNVPVVASSLPTQQQPVVSSPVATVPVVSSPVASAPVVTSSDPARPQTVLSVQPQVSIPTGSTGDVSNYVVANSAEQQQIQPVIQANQQQLLTANQNLPENFIIPVVIPIVRKSPVNILNLIQRQPILSSIVQPLPQIQPTSVPPVQNLPLVQPTSVLPVQNLPLVQPTSVLPVVSQVQPTAVPSVQLPVVPAVTQEPVTVTPVPPVITPVLPAEHKVTRIA